MPELTYFAEAKEVSPESPDLVVESGTLSRRRVLNLVALSAAGIFVSTHESHAFFGLFFGKRSAADLGIPHKWIRQLGKECVDYANYIDRMRLGRVAVLQVVGYDYKQRGNVHNVIPPKRQWKYIKATLQVADRIGHELGMPASQIVSAYRSPAYNRRCGGASRSQHMYNRALDIRFPTSAYQVTRAARDLRARGLFKGGVGSYSSFTHVDTRGENRDW